MKQGLKIKKHLSSFQMIILGFALVILVGAVLLSLPFSSQSGKVTPFSDALFTATSAVCVTGLIVQDTATHWSLFGQIIIISLIQIGGMGVVTVAASFAWLSGRKIGLFQRSTMQEAMGVQKMGGIVRMMKFILGLTLCIELLGAAAMAPVFCRDFGLLKGLWFSIFHSISAFCNAGFDLLGETAKFSSLTSYAENPVINITIMLLILFGGLGFLTWDDIRTHHIHLRKYRMQSKVILSMTLILVFIPSLLFFFTEFENEPMGNRILYSLFQAVTPRTAGFNTVNFSTMSEAGITVMLLLMLIGGAPGSTAGGMKTTTVAVLFAAAASVFRRRDNARFFGRRIDEGTIRHAAAILLMYLGLFLGGSLAISIIENLPILTCMFEAGSAVATVGLTMGITPELSFASQLILIVLMFLGRVGGLTLIYAAFSGIRQNLSKLPQEKITVG